MAFSPPPFADEPPLPPRKLGAYRLLLLLIIALSLIPAGLLLAKRLATEQDNSRLSLVIDELALEEQAAYLGKSAEELAAHYHKLGVNGIALYEETLESLANKGQLALLDCQGVRSQAAAAGDRVPELPEGCFVVSELTAGALQGALEKYRPPKVQLAGQTWYVFSEPKAKESLGKKRPAGPDLMSISRYQDAAWDVAYRPRNFPGMRAVGEDFPEVPYLIYEGLELTGNPNQLAATLKASAPYLTGVIEGTPQAGMSSLYHKTQLLRVFSISQDWLNTLKPQDVIDKYALAADERGARILYLRPYTNNLAGDMQRNSDMLIRGLHDQLVTQGFQIGRVTPLSLQSSLWLRAGAAVGIFAGLLLLASLFPGGWGAVAAFGVVALGLLAGGWHWDALALIAALSFPTLAYGLLPAKPGSLILGVGCSLVGAALLAAVGSETSTLMAISPFAGVAATLLVPPLLFFGMDMLREKPLLTWLRELRERPVLLSDLLIGLVVMGALTFIVMRRGNFPLIEASSSELKLRTLLSEYFARPRFKELLGHPLALLALLNPTWPRALRRLLLTAGVVALASVVNSFSHYHTPLQVSLERTLVALALGFVLGLILHALVQGALALAQTWFRQANVTAQNPLGTVYDPRRSYPQPAPERAAAEAFFPAEQAPAEEAQKPQTRRRLFVNEAQQKRPQRKQKPAKHRKNTRKRRSHDDDWLDEL